MSIEKQATFYLRNVCDYEPSIKCDINLSDSLVRGFAQFSELLRTIYSDWRSYEISGVPSVRTKIGIMSDDLENYHNLTYMIDCLFAIAAVGEFYTEGTTGYLRVNKVLFKSAYKKSVAFPFIMLNKYGFFFVFYKNDKETTEYKYADCFDIYYENGSSLIEAISFIAKRVSGFEKKKEMPPKVAFMLSDYDFILTGNVNVDCTKDRIKNTLGQYSDLWIELVRVMRNECGLTPETSFNPYVFPNRTITFKRGKKTVCKFTIDVERLGIRLPLSFDVAKELILKRADLPSSIDKNIGRFGCVNCGKCTGKQNIVDIEGVPLCNLPYSNFVTEDSRCLVFDVTSVEEVEVICATMHLTFLSPILPIPLKIAGRCASPSKTISPSSLKSNM